MQIISLNIPKSARVYNRSLSSLTGYKSIHVSLINSESGAVNVLEKLLLWCQLVRLNFNGKPDQYLFKWFESYMVCN